MKKLVIIFGVLIIWLAFSACNNINIKNTNNSTFINTEEYMVQKDNLKTVEEINNIFGAYPIDIDEAEKKGLAENGKINEHYYSVKIGYMDLLNQYLNSKIDLDKYQAKFDSDINIYNCNRNDATKIFGSFGRNNIIIRNNLYVERLSIEQIKIIDEYVSNETRASTEALSVVEETYKDVIALYYPKETYVSHIITYDVDGFTGVSGSNDSILIEIRYDAEYDKKGNQSDKVESAKYAFAFDIGEEIKNAIKESIEQDAVIVIN